MLCGEHNAHLQLLEKKIGLTVNVRGNTVHLQGGDWEIELAEKVLFQLYELIKHEYPIYVNDVDYAIRILSSDISADLKKIFLDKVYISSHKKTITPKSLNQKEYIDGIRRFDIVFGIGPAGTGKTYLAMAMAISSLVKKEVNRVVLARPAVGGGLEGLAHVVDGLLTLDVGGDRQRGGEVHVGGPVFRVSTARFLEAEAEKAGLGVGGVVVVGGVVAERVGLDCVGEARGSGGDGVFAIGHAWLEVQVVGLLDAADGEGSP